MHAPEYLIDGAASRLIRRRQTIDDLCEAEFIPERTAGVAEAQESLAKECPDANRNCI
jgi:diaminopimelate decarboxylase